MENYQNCRKYLEKFVRTFQKKIKKKNIFNIEYYKTEKIYLIQCKEMIKGQRNKFIFDLEDLLTTPHSELKDLAFFNTQRFLEILNLSLISFFSINSYLFSTSNRNPGFLNEKGLNSLKKGYTFFNNNYDFQIILIPPKIFPTETFKCLNASMIGKLILFNGICLSHKSIITRLKLATYFCKNCGSKISSKINESTFKPVLYCFSKICEKKFNRKLFLDINLSKFQNFQVIKCSDIEEEEKFEDSKEEIEIFLNEANNEHFYPGIKIRCAGILLPSAYEWVSTVGSYSNFFFQATFIEKLGYKFQHKRRFFLRQQYILELIRSPNLYDRISNSLLPYAIDDTNLKKSLTLAIVNSRSFSKKKSFEFRHQIHILLIGDFNIGKSSFLKMVSTLLPNARYINPLGSIFKTFFTSKINKDPNFFFPEVSESIIFDEGIFFIDNAFFLKDREYFKIEEILDNQLNFTGKYSPKITIIASTKKFQHFEIQRKTTKTGGGKAEFLQKFDLVFIKENGLSYNQNQKISNYLLENFGKKNDILQNKNSIDENLLKAFFSESEHIYPKFTKISIEMAIYNYVLLKTGNVEKFKVNLNIKHLISIIRLSMALAKLNFRNIISINDTKEASRLLISSIISIKNLKLPETQSTSLSNENNIYNLIRKTSLRLKKSILSLLYLSKLSFSMGFSGEDFAKCLETYENLNVWAISLKQLKLVFLL